MIPEHDGCPCTHGRPCDPRCTCVMPFSSSGCHHCCAYGSDEQQRDMANFIADAIAAHRATIISTPSQS